MYRHKCLLLSALLLFTSTPTSAIWPFPPKRFTGNSLVDAGSLGIGGDDRIIAFGDFNGDQFLDLLALGPDQQTLQVYLWSHDEFFYKRSTSFRHPRPIYNVVPGDFTHSGKLDLLVMGRGSDSTQLDMLVYPGLLDGSFDISSPLSVPASTMAQPITVDMDGDMKIDLLGITPFSKGSASPLRLWQNVWNASQPNSPLFEILEPKLTGEQCTLSNPHSNAVVDLNGDCLADIFLVCDDSGGRKRFQIWVNNKDDGFSLAQTGLLPSGLQSITFADMDRDGTIDMVFTTCSYVSSSSGLGTDCAINIAYNKQLPLCASNSPPKSAGSCRPPDNLCVADPDFKFDLRESGDNDGFARIPISSLFPTSDGTSTTLLVLDTTFNPPVPLPIRLGDANLDGFPDILQVVATHSDQTPKLLFSVPCERGLPGCAQDGRGRRSFKVTTKGVQSLNAVKDAISATFLDMDEDGTLDIMIQRKGSNGMPKVLFIQNNFYYDAFFLKAIVLNGACGNGWCYSPNGTIKYHPFGVSYAGASYKYTVLDTSGRRSAAQVGQLPQTAYHSLMAPYSYFGLGRTNNYIENLFVGSTIHSKEHYIDMEGVIPNSKVVILPPPREGEPWKRELFLRPGAWIPWVTVTVIIGTGLLAVIVFVLHMNEKREDELERRRASHHINFDAL
ncbi:hypothetical protein PLEOSDRAFT_1052766 [Pleurotus ostreatus PC15]|uniref:T-cell immunomodulatory protein TIP C2 domain-containing protein n=1 Tax=Pleurotus ostreatus (strain PC15) TaxID=1137138 RepID=A0A067P1F6_PLEO1|nr:hypothetical protein PLEOSDRAFT_1052766 [Pleurotus ostreatus PC15]